MQIMKTCRNIKCDNIVILEQVDGTNNFYNSKCSKCGYYDEAMISP